MHKLYVRYMFVIQLHVIFNDLLNSFAMLVLLTKYVGKKKKPVYNDILLTCNTNTWPLCGCFTSYFSQGKMDSSTHTYSYLFY